MNNVIKRLLGESSLYALEQRFAPNEHTGRELSEVAVEKFAELIIKECAALVEDGVIEVEDDNGNIACVSASEIIEHHFGIK